MTSIYTGGGSLIPPGQNNPGSQPYGTGIAGIPTSSPNPFTQNPYSPAGTAFEGFGNDTPLGGGILSPYAQQPNGTAIGNNNPVNPYTVDPYRMGGGGLQPLHPGGRPFFGFGDDLPMMQVNDTPSTGGILSGYAAQPQVNAQPLNDTPQGQGTLSPLQTGFSGQLMPTQPIARERHDIMYGASPMNGFNPFFANGMTQGQASAAANTTATTTPAVGLPSLGFTGTDPFIQNTLSEAQVKAQGKGMAQGGIAGLTGNAIYPQSRTDETQYAINTQLPTSSEVVGSDYDAKTDPYNGMPYRFAKGGITSIPRYDGEDGSQVETPSWNPESGTVKLQQLEDPKDPFSPVKSVIDYTIPKDQFKSFDPDIDLETGAPTGSGAYVLKDGSTMRVNGQGIVQAVTPSRSDYTLNKEGYYQPTGSNLTWDPNVSRLTKKVGGVDVEVPGLFTKGGYQDDKGNLRTDANGVPIPLAPAQFDSGAGKSGLSDAAPYIAAAAMLAATGMPTGFEGMVPASETLLGSMGASGVGSTAGISSADLGTTPYIAPSSSVSSAATPAAEVASKAAPVYDFSTPYSGPLNYAGEAAKTTGMTGTQKFLAASMAAKALSGGSGGGSGGGGPTSSTTTTTEAAPRQNIASNQYNPSMAMANINAMNTSGIMYNPMIYSYNTRRAAQGGLMYQQGGVADLGGYAAGGKLLKGPGDGMSDDIVANIAGKQPARLADGEFVVPADVVSHLGNGSTDAGAKHLYKMMDRIRKARTGNPKQGKRINPDKFLPKG